MAIRRAFQRILLVQHLRRALPNAISQALAPGCHPPHRRKQPTNCVDSWSNQCTLQRSNFSFKDYSSSAREVVPLKSPCVESEFTTETSTDPSVEKLDAETPASRQDSTAGSTQIAPSMRTTVESAFKSSSRHDLAMLFTCTVCDTRSAKTMSRRTYETGVVIVRCPGCNNLHLIADRYGWFGAAGSVEDFLAEKGVDVRTGSDSSYEFSVEDIAGWTPPREPGKL